MSLVMSDAALAVVTESASAAQPPEWHSTSNPLPSTNVDSGLGDVSCVTQDWCAAVGFSYGQPFAQHWDGTSWTVVASRTVAGGAGLKSLDCLSTVWCIAVGTSGAGTFAELWDGSSWSAVASPSPAAASSQLVSVSCSSSSECTAVGSQTSAGVASPLVEQWDGTSWTVVAVPNPDSAHSVTLNSVSCPTATLCMAVGTDTTSATTWQGVSEIWDGTTWSAVPVANTGTQNALTGVSCGTSTSCYAVGGTNGASQADIPTAGLVDAWDGATWTSPFIGFNNQDYHWIAIDCLSASYCAAVGEASAMEHVAGWQNETDSFSLVGMATGVSCVAQSMCVAAGTQAYPTGSSFPTGGSVPVIWSDYQVVNGYFGAAPAGVDISSPAPAVPSGVPATYTATLGSLPVRGEVSFYGDTFSAPLPGCASIPVTSPDPNNIAGTASCTAVFTGAGIHQLYAVFSGGAFRVTSFGMLIGGQQVTEGIIITTTSLPGATAFKYYSTTLHATTNKPPVKWALVSGSLPTGLHLSAGGVISGTPTAPSASSAW